MNPVVITIIFKAEESTFRKKFLCYDHVTLIPGDPVITKYVEEMKREFNDIYDEIIVKTSMSF
jgi:hypothetical protein